MPKAIATASVPSGLALLDFAIDALFEPEEEQPELFAGTPQVPG